LTCSSGQSRRIRAWPSSSQSRASSSKPPRVEYTPPEPLDRRHVVDEFECGQPPLDDWLKKYAKAAQASGSSRVFVTTTDGVTVVGYYALAAAQIEPAEATARVIKGEPKLRPVPAVLLARLAVDRNHQGVGVGRSLLKDAVLRCLVAANSIGVRAMLIHSKDDEARGWYEQYGFEPSPTDPLHLMLLMKDLRAFVEQL
jgi:GNAT superfamily N-acetyltransferase